MVRWSSLRVGLLQRPLAAAVSQSTMDSGAWRSMRFTPAASVRSARRKPCYIPPSPSPFLASRQCANIIKDNTDTLRLYGVSRARARRAPYRRMHH
ncbi:hypothetical protein C8F01DRAFT_1130255 [Mycena amicta]|nr:hypothetical protein C8F01DRAFT_1130255 [Mycena amicta]